MLRACALLIVSVLVGCGASPSTRSTVAREPQPLEELRITAVRDDAGDLGFESYDAETLFDRGNELAHEDRWQDAIVLYDRLVAEFPTSRYVSPSLYNAGLCLERVGDRAASVERFQRIVSDHADGNDARDAGFQVARVALDIEGWAAARSAAEWLLARTDLTTDQRLEAMARRAQALLGGGERDPAGQQAREALSYYRTRRGDDRIADPYFAAAANYVLAESLRLRSEAIAIPAGEVSEQRTVLEARAQLLLDAQREYFNTIRHTDASWAAAAGYRIGSMYDAFWDAIMAAPTPPPSTALPAGGEAQYEDEYRAALRRLVKPLIRHAIRYWELTLLMVERTGVESEWRRRTEADLERARARLLEQPDGPEGLPRPSDPPCEGEGCSAVERPGPA